jgi:perosamine synthetase
MPLRTFPRKRPDIGWADFVATLRATVMAPPADAMVSRIRALFPEPSEVWVGLSVRTGFDLLLRALDFPPGSEVLVSAVTTGDMVRLLEHHGLVPVPVDLDLDTLGPVDGGMDRAVTPSTRAVLVAHLFGARTDLDDVVRFAERHGLVLIEDGAQATAGASFTGHTGATATMLSYGPIKTATALGAGIVVSRDPGLLERMEELEAHYPRRSRRRFATRVVKYAALKLLTTPTVYGAFVRLVGVTGRDPDRVVNESARGFPGPQLIEQIRKRPPVNLLALLERRLRRFDPQTVEEQRHFGEYVASLLPPRARRPGSACAFHGYWLFPVLVEEPEDLARVLRSVGLDATCARGSLTVVESPPDRPELDPRAGRDMLERVVYLPVSPDLPQSAVGRLIRAVEAVTGRRGGGERREPTSAALGTG